MPCVPGRTMRHLRSLGIGSRKLRLASVLALTATVSAVMAGPASAEPILHERFHDEGTFVEQNFCGVPGLTVEGAFVVDGRVLAVPHGPLA
jgi:hypothetical protein